MSSLTVHAPLPPTDAAWRISPSLLTLGAGEVHVWRMRLDAMELGEQGCEELLSLDELRRAARFYFRQDRARFVVVRGMLRKLSGKYLGLLPQNVAFSYAAFGKPAVQSAAGQSWLRFNVSHSGDMALYAFARDREVGIDVERKRDITDFAVLSRRVFSPGEQVALAAIPPRQQLDAFFRCWSRKEAFIKATGRGLSKGLDKFEVSLQPEAEPALLSVEGSAEQAERWELRDVQVAPGYAGALAVEGAGSQRSYWECPVR